MPTDNPVAEAQQAVREMSGEDHVMPLPSTAVFDCLNAAALIGLVLSALGVVAGFLFAGPGSDLPGGSLIGWSILTAIATGLIMAGLLIVRDMIRLQAAIAVELRLIRKRLYAPAAAEKAQNSPPPVSTSPSLR